MSKRQHKKSQRVDPYAPNPGSLELKNANDARRIHGLKPLEP